MFFSKKMAFEFISWAIVFCSVSSLAYAEKIKLGYVDFPPFMSTEDDKASGYIIDYFESEIFLSDEIEWVHVPLKRVGTMLESKKIDYFISYFYSEARAKKFDFSKFSYYTFKSGICFDKQKHDIKKFSDDFKELKGNRLVHFAGTMRKASFFRDKTVQLQSISSNSFRTRALDLIVKSRADFGYFVDLNFLEPTFKAKESYKSIKCLPINESYPNFVVASKKWKKIDAINLKFKGRAPLKF